MEYIVEPIGVIRNNLKEKFGVPRQSCRVRTVSRIVFFDEYAEESAFRDIEGFNYLWILFDFSLAHREGWSPTVRPPRLGGNKKVGVFASRSPFRPNHIGLSSVKLLEVERKEGRVTLVVEGADIMDGTPILDIKPYLPSDSHTDAVGGYADGVVNHRLEVVFPEEYGREFTEEEREEIVGCLAEDPRPSYIEDSERVYGMRYGERNVKFTVSGEVLTVVGVD